jgi:hypothetical protein
MKRVIRKGVALGLVGLASLGKPAKANIPKTNTQTVAAMREIAKLSSEEVTRVRTQKKLEKEIWHFLELSLGAEDMKKIRGFDERLPEFERKKQLLQWHMLSPFEQEALQEKIRNALENWKKIKSRELFEK